MKYDPRNIIFSTKNQLEKYAKLIIYSPQKDRYLCPLCKKQFLTPLGAFNHVDYKHEDKIIEIKDKNK